MVIRIRDYVLFRGALTVFYTELVDGPNAASLEPLDRSCSVLSLLYCLPFSAQELSFASVGLDLRHDLLVAGGSVMYSSLTSYVLLWPMAFEKLIISTAVLVSLAFTLTSYVENLDLSGRG